MADSFTNWALDRGGFFTRGEAKDCGYHDNDIQAAVRDGIWVRLRHGYYSTGDHVAGLDPGERHRLLARAVHHRLGPEYVLVGVSACAMHEIELWGTDLSTVHVARIGGRRGRTEAGIQFHDFPFDPNDATIEIGAVRVMNPAHAVWHASCQLSIEGGLVCMNSALHHEIVSPEAIEELAPNFSRWRGSRSARIAYRLTDRRVETVGESRTLFLCWEFHLPRPEPQFEVYDAQGTLVARTDFAWLSYRHVCEFDGMAKYVRYLRPGESTADAVIREKRREDLVRAESLGMSRVTWIDIDGTTRRRRTATGLRGGLEQSQRLYANNRTIIA